MYLALGIVVVAFVVLVFGLPALVGYLTNENSFLGKKRK